MPRIEMTNGYESFEAWRDAGYPGAVSFNKDGERKPNPRRGLCAVPDCTKIVRLDGRCDFHYMRARTA